MRWWGSAEQRLRDTIVREKHLRLPVSTGGNEGQAFVRETETAVHVRNTPSPKGKGEKGGGVLDWRDVLDLMHGRSRMTGGVVLMPCMAAVVQGCDNCYLQLLVASTVTTSCTSAPPATVLMVCPQKTKLARETCIFFSKYFVNM